VKNSEPLNNKKMDIQTILILIIVGVAAGALSGLVGVGGGIIIVPALVYFVGFSQFRAQGTSLGILLLPVGILAVWQFYKQGHIDLPSVLFVALGFVIGGYIGSKITLSLPQETVRKLFAVLIVVIGIKMLLDNKKKPATLKSSPPTEIIDKQVP